MLQLTFTFQSTDFFKIHNCSTTLCGCLPYRILSQSDKTCRTCRPNFSYAFHYSFQYIDFHEKSIYNSGIKCKDSTPKLNQVDTETYKVGVQIHLFPQNIAFIVPNLIKLAIVLQLLVNKSCVKFYEILSNSLLAGTRSVAGCGLHIRHSYFVVVVLQRMTINRTSNNLT
jgi:hypothetical protein